MPKIQVSKCKNMNASEKIKYITNIANQLSIKKWDIVDLTLRQFDLPWTDQWQGEKRAYVMEMIREATEEQLISLAEHLNIAIYATNPTSQTLIKELIKQVELQKSSMISVSTGGPRIETVDNEYKKRRLEIVSSLHELRIEDPNPYSDLWSWYGKWSDGSLPTYQSRRQNISALYQPLIDSLISRLRQGKPQALRKPTGWARVDRNVDKIVNQLAKAFRLSFVVLQLTYLNKWLIMRLRIRLLFKNNIM